MKAVVLALAAFLIPRAFAADPVKVVPPQQKVLSSPNGRYVFGQVSDFRSDQYLLDTHTGRLWRVVLRQSKNPDGSPTGESFPVLDWMPFSNPDGKLGITPN